LIVKISNYDVIIKDRDYEKFCKCKWYIRSRNEKHPYFVTNMKINGKNHAVSLHRYLMDCVPYDDKMVDHIDGNTLNNDTDNLRFCTKTENARNVKKRSHNKSGYKGVSWSKSRKKWLAQIKPSSKKTINLGCYTTPELAHEAYREASIKYHKEFGRVE